MHKMYVEEMRLPAISFLVLSPVNIKGLDMHLMVPTGQMCAFVRLHLG